MRALRSKALVDYRARLEGVLLAALASAACSEGPVDDASTLPGSSIGTGESSESNDATATGTTGGSTGASEASTDDGTPEVPQGDCEKQWVFEPSPGCDDIVGWFWATGGCRPLYACACEGEDCDELYADHDSCEAAHSSCSVCDPCPDACVVYCSGTGLLEGYQCQQTTECPEFYMGYSCAGSIEPVDPEVDGHCAGLGRALFTVPLTHESSARGPAAWGRAWATIAACEGASVHSFEALAQALDALGAPAHMAALALEHAEDERRHAAFATKLARQLGAEVQQSDSPPTPLSLEALARETFLGGCIGETLSALELQRMAAACTEPVLAAGLRQIAQEEQEHAEAAWTLAAWLLHRFPQLRTVAHQAFASGCDTLPLELDEDALAWGLLSDAQRQAQWARARELVVAPLARTLLAPSIDRAVFA